MRLPSPTIRSATKTRREPPRLDQFAPKHEARSFNRCLKTVATRGVKMLPCGRNLHFLPWNGKKPRRWVNPYRGPVQRCGYGEARGPGRLGPKEVPGAIYRECHSSYPATPRPVPYHREPPSPCLERYYNFSFLFITPIRLLPNYVIKRRDYIKFYSRLPPTASVEMSCLS